MQDKVISKREYRYKGKAPFNSDRIIGWWSKLLLQLIIFSIIYTVYIPIIRQKYNNFFIEFIFVFFWLVGSDFLAFLLALIIKIAFNYKMKYLPTNRKRGRNLNRKAWEYLIYTSLRCFFYMIGVTPALAMFFYSLMPFLWGYFAYFLVWLIIFITSKLLAKIGSVLITKSV